MGSTSKWPAGDAARRVKIGVGLLLLVLATQFAGSIAMARSRHDGGTCAVPEMRLVLGQKAACHVS